MSGCNHERAGAGSYNPLIANRLPPDMTMTKAMKIRMIFTSFY
jgi:hypothetical protein